MFNDVMVDYDYEAGMSSRCSGIKCCNKESGEAAEEGDAAGEWGDLKCYLPPKTLKSMLDFIHDDIKPDFAFWSGNVLAHSHDEAVRSERLNQVMDTVSNTLGPDVKLYFSLGSEPNSPEF